GSVGGERRALLVLPARHDDEAVVPVSGPEELEQVLACIDRGGVFDVVPAGALPVITTQRAELDLRRVESGAEQQERHRADAHGVVAEFDGAGESSVQVLERLTRPGAGVPGEVPQTD